METKQIPSYHYNHTDHVNYVFHLWFRILRPCRLKYRLSVNCLMILNAVYLFNKYEKKDFTYTELLKFVTYYNRRSLMKFFKVLLYNGYVIQEGYYKKHCALYHISSKGVECIEEMKKSYDSVVSLYMG